MKLGYNFFIGIFLVIIFSWNVSFAENPCDEVKNLKRERLEYDVQARLKRVELRQKIIDYKIKDNELEKKMAETESKTINAPKSETKALWDQYELLGKQREELSGKIGEVVYNEYLKISFERAQKRLSYKKELLSEEYKCILNETLNSKLGEIAKAVDKGDNSFKTLYQQRMGMIEKIKKDYAQFVQNIDKELNNYKVLIDKYMSLMNDEKTLEGLQDKKYDEASAVLNNLENSLDSTELELAKISEQLLTYLK